MAQLAARARTRILKGNINAWHRNHDLGGFSCERLEKNEYNMDIPIALSPIKN